MAVTGKADEGSPMAIVLDGSKIDDMDAKVARETIVNELTKAGMQCSQHILRDINMAPCIGCFKCWINTPGECAFKDKGKDIVMDLARCKLVVLITPVTFGGYSFELKKGLDRLIPVLLPDFVKFDGETHHPHRYGKGWDLFAVGTISKEKEQNGTLFKALVERNSLNMHSKKKATCVIVHGQDADAVRNQVADSVRKVLA